MLFLSPLATGRCMLASSVRPPLAVDSPSHILRLTDSTPPFLTPPLLTPLGTHPDQSLPHICSAELLLRLASWTQSVRPSALSDRRCVGGGAKKSRPSLSPGARLRAARAGVGGSQSLIISLQERRSAVRVDRMHLLLQEPPACRVTEGHDFGRVWLCEKHVSPVVVFFLQCLDNTEPRIPHTIKARRGIERLQSGPRPSSESGRRPRNRASAVLTLLARV